MILTNIASENSPKFALPAKIFHEETQNGPSKLQCKAIRLWAGQWAPDGTLFTLKKILPNDVSRNIFDKWNN